MKDLIDNNDTEIEDVSAQADIRYGGNHQDDEYQMLVVPVEGREEDADWIRDNTVTLRLADGDSMIRVALNGSQTQHLRDALDEIIDPEADDE